MKSRRKKLFVILASIIVILLVIRLTLPSIIVHKVNKVLSSLVGYKGHVDDIDLVIIRGGCVIKGLEIKREPASEKPLRHFKADNIDASIEWKALFHGHIVGQAVINDPVIVFTKTKVPSDTIAEDTVNVNILKKLMPLKINRFEINGGSVHYVDSTSKPKVDISMKQIHILALNLSNVYDSVNELPSTITAQSNIYGGSLNFNMKLNALAKAPTFDMNAELKNTELPLLNDFLMAYGKFTVHQGSFSLYTEIAAKDGKFKGYVKPLIENLKVIGPEDRKDSFFHKVWESIVGTVSSVLKNKKEDQIASKIPLEGTFKRPKTRLWYAVNEVLRNAFIQALLPSIDREINIKSIDSNEDQLHKMAQTDRKKEEKNKELSENKKLSEKKR